MNLEIFENVQKHYKVLDEIFKDKCLELPFHRDGPEYTAYCETILKPFKQAMIDMMELAADEEDFEKALAIQIFLKNRMANY